MGHPPHDSGGETRLSDDSTPPGSELPGLDGTTVESEEQPGADAAAALDALDPIALQGRPRVGDVFFGRYLVERPLGEGGMGTVWLVRHLELDAPRALKLIVSGIAFDPQVRARFRREARAMARLTHPGAVVVHDARIGRDAAFIEMEYVRGESLNRLLKPGVPMPLDWTARLLDQLCDVLHEAHQQRIVHRDLKPSNLMLVADRPPGKEQLKVLDFGIAKLLGAEASEASTEDGDVRTVTGCFLGSAAWSSPEQAAGEEIDVRSDLYSVGVIVYELLTGSRPFNGPLVRQLYDHLHTPPPAFSTINPRLALPPAVEQAVRRCLAKNPSDRPQTARDLAAEFLWAASDGKAPSSLSGSGPSALAPRPSADPARTEVDLENATPGTRVQVAGGFLASTDAPTALPATEHAPLDAPAWANQPTEPDTRGGAATIKAGPGPGDAPPELGPIPAPWSIPAAFLIMAIIGLALAAWVVSSMVPRGRPRTAPPAGYEVFLPPPGDPRAPALVRTADQTRFILIPGGEFVMGNAGFDRTGQTSDEDQPAHPVILSDYYLQETEVTNQEMDAYFVAQKIMRSARPRHYQEAWDRIDKAGLAPGAYPAVGISHALAEGYARWVGGKLPTEAQWEYAARSRGEPMRYVWEGDDKPSKKYANIDTTGLHADLTTSEVRSYPRDRTEQGIFDLTGNVREWCRDGWTPYVDSEAIPRDPVSPPRTTTVNALDFVVRGGSFATPADLFRTTRPRRVEPHDYPTADQLIRDQAAFDVGFRVVIEWPRGR